MSYETIIVAVIAAAGSIIGGYLANTKTIAVIQEQIRQLTARVEKHNSLVERTYKLESDVQTAFVRIDELKDTIR